MPGVLTSLSRSREALRRELAASRKLSSSLLQSAPLDTAAFIWGQDRRLSTKTESPTCTQARAWPGSGAQPHPKGLNPGRERGGGAAQGKETHRRAPRPHEAQGPESAAALGPSSTLWRTSRPPRGCPAPHATPGTEAVAGRQGGWWQRPPQTCPPQTCPSTAGRIRPGCGQPRAPRASVRSPAVPHRATLCSWHRSPPDTGCRSHRRCGPSGLS